MKDLNGGYAEDGDRIGEVGSIRLAKAVWVMMARLAGWDGGSTLYSTFTEYGLYKNDGSAWNLLTNIRPANMVASGNF